MPTLKGTETSLSYVHCFLYLVSSSINVSIFHITWLDTYETVLVYIRLCVYIYIYTCTQTIYTFIYVYIYIYIYYIYKDYIYTHAIIYMNIYIYVLSRRIFIEDCL